MSHPKQTKAITSARLKSDKVDALMVAKLLKADLLPTVWISPAARVADDERKDRLRGVFDPWWQRAVSPR
jgi:hypothetical protein